MPTPEGPLVSTHPAFELVRNHACWAAHCAEWKHLKEFIVKWGGEPDDNSQLQFDNFHKVLTKTSNTTRKQCMKLLRENYPDISQPGTYIDRVITLTVDWNGNARQA